MLLLEGWKAAITRLGLGSMSLLVARQALQPPRQLCWDCHFSRLVPLACLEPALITRIKGKAMP